MGGIKIFLKEMFKQEKKLHIICKADMQICAYAFA